MTDEEALARRVAQALVDDEPDPKWIRLAEGKMSFEERANIEREAEIEREVAAALSVYAPPTAEERASLIAHAKGVVARQSQTRFRRRSVGAGMLAMAAAAAVGLAIWPSPELEPLPNFSVTVRAGDVRTRGEAEPGPIRPDSIIEVLLRPAEIVSEPIEAVAFVYQEGGPLKRLDEAPEVSPQGVVRLRVHGRNVASPGKEANLILVAARENALPSEAHLVDAQKEIELSKNIDADQTLAGAGWRAVSLKVKVESER